MKNILNSKYLLASILFISKTETQRTMNFYHGLNSPPVTSLSKMAACEFTTELLATAQRRSVPINCADRSYIFGQLISDWLYNPHVAIAYWEGLSGSFQGLDTVALSSAAEFVSSSYLYS